MTVHGVEPDFGQQLTALLERTGVSASELGRRLGHKDGRSVRRWKNSHVSPGYETARKIAEALGEGMGAFSRPIPPNGAPGPGPVVPEDFGPDRSPTERRPEDDEAAG